MSPLYLSSTSSYDRAAILRAAHAACQAQLGNVRLMQMEAAAKHRITYSLRFRDALRRVWAWVQTERSKFLSAQAPVLTVIVSRADALRNELLGIDSDMPTMAGNHRIAAIHDELRRIAA